MPEERTEQVLNLENRRVLKMNTVKNVESFDEEELVLESALGEVHVEGEELRIEALSKERGEILILGKIDSVYFLSEKAKTERRPFSRWFK